MPRRTPVRELQKEEAAPSSSLRRSSRLHSSSPVPTKKILTRRNSASDTTTSTPKTTRNRRSSLSQEPQPTRETETSSNTKIVNGSPSVVGNGIDKIQTEKPKTRRSSISKEESQEEKRSTRSRRKSVDVEENQSQPILKRTRSRSGSISKKDEKEENIVRAESETSNANTTDVGKVKLVSTPVKKLPADGVVQILDSVGESSKELDSPVITGPKSNFLKKRKAEPAKIDLDLSIINEASLTEEDTSLQKETEASSLNLTKENGLNPESTEVDVISPAKSVPDVVNENVSSKKDPGLDGGFDTSTSETSFHLQLSPAIWENSSKNETDIDNNASSDKENISPLGKSAVEDSECEPMDVDITDFDISSPPVKINKRKSGGAAELLKVNDVEKNLEMAQTISAEMSLFLQEQIHSDVKCNEVETKQHEIQSTGVRNSSKILTTIPQNEEVVEIKPSKDVQNSPKILTLSHQKKEEKEMLVTDVESNTDTSEVSRQEEGTEQERGMPSGAQTQTNIDTKEENIEETAISQNDNEATSARQASNIEADADDTCQRTDLEITEDLCGNAVDDSVEENEAKDEHQNIADSEISQNITTSEKNEIYPVVEKCSINAATDLTTLKCTVSDDFVEGSHECSKNKIDVNKEILVEDLDRGATETEERCSEVLQKEEIIEIDEESLLLEDAADDTKVIRESNLGDLDSKEESTHSLNDLQTQFAGDVLHLSNKEKWEGMEKVDKLDSSNEDSSDRRIDDNNSSLSKIECVAQEEKEYKTDENNADVDLTDKIQIERGTDENADQTSPQTLKKRTIDESESSDEDEDFAVIECDDEVTQEEEECKRDESSIISSTFIDHNYESRTQMNAGADIDKIDKSSKHKVNESDFKEQTEIALVDDINKSLRRSRRSVDNKMAIVMQDNIKAGESKDQLADRIHKMVEVFCGGIKNTSDIAVNVSFDYTSQLSDSDTENNEKTDVVSMNSSVSDDVGPDVEKVEHKGSKRRKLYHDYESVQHDQTSEENRKSRSKNFTSSPNNSIVPEESSEDVVIDEEVNSSFKTEERNRKTAKKLRKSKSRKKKKSTITNSSGVVPLEEETSDRSKEQVEQIEQDDSYGSEDYEQVVDANDATSSSDEQSEQGDGDESFSANFSSLSQMINSEISDGDDYTWLPDKDTDSSHSVISTDDSINDEETEEPPEEENKANGTSDDGSASDDVFEEKEYKSSSTKKRRLFRLSTYTITSALNTSEKDREEQAEERAQKKPKLEQKKTAKSKRSKDDNPEEKTVQRKTKKQTMFIEEENDVKIFPAISEVSGEGRTKKGKEKKRLTSKMKPKVGKDPKSVGKIPSNFKQMQVKPSTSAPSGWDVEIIQ